MPASRACRAGASALSLVVAGVLLVACSAGSAEQPGRLRQVSVVLDWAPNTNHSGLYLAEAEGLFAERGLDVTIVEPGELSGLQLVAAGQADFAYSTAESLVALRGHGADVVSVAAVIQHNTSSLVSLAESGIDRPADLAGAAYGTYGSDMEAALVSSLVACDGGDPERVEMAPLAGYDFRIGLTEDHFDAVWVFDGWDTIRLRDLDGLDVSTLAFADYTSCIPDWYTPLLAASRDLLDSDPDLARDFLSAVAEGYRGAMADPAAAVAALVGSVPELDEQLLVPSAEYLSTRYTDDPVRWGAQDAQVWATFVEFLQEHGLADAGLDVDAVWTDDYLPAP